MQYFKVFSLTNLTRSITYATLDASYMATMGELDNFDVAKVEQTVLGEMEMYQRTDNNMRIRSGRGATTHRSDDDAFASCSVSDFYASCFSTKGVLFFLFPKCKEVKAMKEEAKSARAILPSMQVGESENVTEQSLTHVVSTDSEGSQEATGALEGTPKKRKSFMGAASSLAS